MAASQKTPGASDRLDPLAIEFVPWSPSSTDLQSLDSAIPSFESVYNATGDSPSNMLEKRYEALEARVEVLTLYDRVWSH
jgi:hypothetical protein